MRRSEELVLFEDDLEMRRRADATLRLQRISTLLIGEGTNGSLYEHVLDAAIDLMSADLGSMQVFHSERGELRLLAERGFDPESAARWEWVHPDSASPCGMALSAGCRVIVPDIETCESLGSADREALCSVGIRAGQSTPLVARSGRLLGMISTHWRSPHRPTERELQPLDVLARQAADLIERNEVEAALRESKEQFRWLASIVDSSDDAIIGKNLDGIITSWNRGAERLYGYAAEEVKGKSVVLLIPPEYQDEEYAIFARVWRGDRVEHYETVHQHKDGRAIDVSLTVSPMRDAEGKIVGCSKIARDIGERKRSAAQLSILAREAEHRAKNLLANVEAMVRLSNSDTPDGLKEAIGGRIRALANVHSLFVQSRWTGAELHSLVDQELSPYAGSGAMRTLISGPAVVLKPNVAQAMAVALHELATNAAKYGALSATKGQVHVEWSRVADGQVVLHWTETGGPPVNPPMRRGFGTSVMESMIRGGAKGRVQFDWRAEGLTCEMAVPT